MRLKTFLLAAFLLLAFLPVQATEDSTLLKRRIDKIMLLKKALQAIPLVGFREVADTILLQEAFKEVEPRFFAPPFRDPVFNIRHALGMLQHFLHSSEKDTFKLQYPDPTKDTNLYINGLTGYLKNTVIAYFHMYDNDFEMFYFSFREGSDQLLYLIEAGGDPEFYRRKKEFMNALHTRARH